MTILITGVAGFIGYHLASRLLAEGQSVYGIDNLNAYYDVRLKQDRLAQLQPHPHFQFQHLDLVDRVATADLFASQAFEGVIHLAAQTGVRYSIQAPMTYVDSNLVGFATLLEGCRHHAIPHLVFASSSSVYGSNRKIPFAVRDPVDQPISLYAATKRANELMAYCYSHLYQLPITGLRFFTVYGPWGRPDMAYFKFVQAIESGKPIDVYNFGKMKRDFTYVDDVIEAIIRVLARIPQPSPQPPGSLPEDQDSLPGSHSTPGATLIPPYRLYNIGNHDPVDLLTFIQVIEASLGKPAILNFLPIQPGDLPVTYADVEDLIADVGFKPTTSLEDGIGAFVRWYRTYYADRLP